MSRYVLTAEAQDDLRQIRDYVLDEGGFRGARHVVGSLVAEFRALARTPGQGHMRDDVILVEAREPGVLPVPAISFSKRPFARMRLESSPNQICDRKYRSP